MDQKLQPIILALQNAPNLLARKKVTAGFDGFVDSIVKVVNHKSNDAETVFFNTIGEFGSYISSKSGSGFSLESEEVVQKLGGNMPIMAHALACMGIGVNCVGALGIPTIAPAFTEMHSNCNIYSYTNPGFTTAIEFADGKIMLAQMTDLNNADWNTIKQTIGIEQLREIFTSAMLVSLVNWSELDHSNSMWQGLLNEVFSYATTQQPLHFFFDLSDCSKRSPEAIKSALHLIEQFGVYGTTTLSLNRNEAGIVHKTLTDAPAPANLQTTGNKLFTILDIHTLIIHSSKVSIAWDEHGMYITEPDFIAQPAISTGAGDNFNAGYCTGTLLGLTTLQCLTLANATSNIYMRTGQSPDIGALHAYFSE